MRLCPWIFQAPTMSSAIGTENKIATRVARRETRNRTQSPLITTYSTRLTRRDTTYSHGRAEQADPDAPSWALFGLLLIFTYYTSHCFSL